MAQGIACAIACAIIGAPADAHAQAAAPTACRLEDAGSGKVATVVDGRSFILDDGREIRLAGIEVPLPPRAGETSAPAEAALASEASGQRGNFSIVRARSASEDARERADATRPEPGSSARAARAARAALAELVAGQTVALRHNPSAIDRYGRMLAHAHIGADGARQSAAHEMLARGFARVAATVGDRACAEELWARERTARHGKLGLWGAEPYYVVLGAESLAELLAGLGEFTVVEGKVWSVRESGGTIYMNFGRRWSQALTVTISKRNERTFAAAGVDVKRLEHRRLRVRGFIEERSGPRIEASRPEQIEIAERN